MSGGPVVHQFTAVLAGRDAVSWHTAAVDSLLRQMGCSTRTFAGRVVPGSGLRAEHFRKHERYPAPDLILYQMSTGSSVGDYLMTRREPLVLNYHNITPAEEFEPWEPHTAVHMVQGRKQLARLARRSRAAIAVSGYNAAELRDLGLDDVSVVPLLWRRPAPRTPTSVPGRMLQARRRLAGIRRGARRRLARARGAQGTQGGGYGVLPGASDGPDMLFVGRVVPHKRQEDLLAALALIRTRRPGARLTLIGSPASQLYASCLIEYAQRLGLGAAVTFAGSVSARVLDAAYASASVYVSASVHEGFCAPLVEAMSAGLPVVAAAAAAVPETVADAALLVDRGSPLQIASAVDRMHHDAVLRSEAVRRGFERAEAFSEESVKQRMRSVLERLSGCV